MRFKNNATIEQEASLMLLRALLLWSWAVLCPFEIHHLTYGAGLKSWSKKTGKEARRYAWMDQCKCNSSEKKPLSHSALETRIVFPAAKRSLSPNLAHHPD